MAYPVKMKRDALLCLLEFYELSDKYVVNTVYTHDVMCYMFTHKYKNTEEAFLLEFLEILKHFLEI